MMWWLLLGTMACAPAREPVQTLGAPVAVTSTERDAVQALAEALAARSSEGERFRDGAQLARSLASGSADSQVRGAAIELLVALRDEPISVAATAPTSRAVEVAPCPVVAEVPVDTGEPPRVVLAEDQIELAREALRASDYRGALDALSPLEGTAAWNEVGTLWDEAVDGWVAQERERAGAIFLAARALRGDERRDGLLEARAVIAGLLDEFPDSAYVDTLTANLVRIEQAIEPRD